MTTLAEAFESFERSAWRLEARDIYLVHEYDDALDAFLSGRPMPPRADGWAEVVRAATKRGATMSRIRLVGHPITDYTRFEFAMYVQNVEFGEDVRIVDRSWLDDSWATAPDVWLFDDRLAFRQIYSDKGEYLGAERTSVDPVVEMRQSLSSKAVGLPDFQLTDE